MTEPSNFEKNFLLNSGHSLVFSQTEFDEALAVAKAEIMAIAIETTKHAILIEREACAEIVERLADEEEEGELHTALKNAVAAIKSRMPIQRQ
jgi:hypothetical protein